MAEDTPDAKVQLLDLLELAFGMEAEGPGEPQPPGKGKPPPVVS